MAKSDTVDPLLQEGLLASCTSTTTTTCIEEDGTGDETSLQQTDDSSRSSDSSPPKEEGAASESQDDRSHAHETSHPLEPTDKVGENLMDQSPEVKESASVDIPASESTDISDEVVKPQEPQEPKDEGNAAKPAGKTVKDETTDIIPVDNTIQADDCALSTTGSIDKADPAATKPQNQTEQVLIVLLERLQNQETSLQKLEKTVESQSETLQDIMTTMKSGFSALLESNKRNNRIDAEKSNDVFPMHEDADAVTDHADGGASIHINQIQLPHHTATKVHRPPRIPPRNPTPPAGSFFAKSTLSTLGMSMADNMVNPSTKASLSFVRSYGTKKIENPQPESQQHQLSSKQASRASAPPVFFGRKSNSVLLDDDSTKEESMKGDSTIATEDLMDHDEHRGHTHNHHHHHDDDDDHCDDDTETTEGHSNSHHRTLDSSETTASEACCTIPSCRRRVAQSKGKVVTREAPCVKDSAKDKKPHHPTYVASPGPRRLTRAITAPMANFGGRSGRGMPPRLPPRENSRTESVAESVAESMATSIDSLGDILEPLPITRCRSAKMPRMPMRDESISQGLDLGQNKSEEEETEREEDDGCEEEEVERALASLKEVSASTGSSQRALSPAPTTVDKFDQSTLTDETAPKPPASPSPRPDLQGSNSWKMNFRTEHTETTFRSEHTETTTMAVVNQAPGSPLESHAIPRSFRGSKRDLFTKDNTHLNVSCVTLDSAFVDEIHEWIADNGQKKVSRTLSTSTDEGLDDNMVIEAEMTDATGETGVYSGAISAKKNRPHGHGIMQYSNGKHYMGGWKEGSWHGTGVLTSASGERYEGEFVFATRHGSGSYEYDNGDVYEGDFSADRPHGKGTFRFADGGIYAGGFVFGNFEGRGWYEFSGGRYEGFWQAGCYHGFGTLQYIDGGCYTGEFEDGMPHGTGEVVLADGVRRKGSWRQGELIEEGPCEQPQPAL